MVFLKDVAVRKQLDMLLVTALTSTVIQLQCFARVALANIRAAAIRACVEDATFALKATAAVSAKLDEV
jgi:hypothetical protein